MSQIAIDFANMWVAENVQATLFAPEEGQHPDTAATLRRFLHDAESEGIEREELEESMGDLGDFISAALGDAAEAELDRLEEEE